MPCPELKDCPEIPSFTFALKLNSWKIKEKGGRLYNSLHLSMFVRWRFDCVCTSYSPDMWPRNVPSLLFLLTVAMSTGLVKTGIQWGR